jgi:hypothetical protein
MLRAEDPILVIELMRFWIQSKIFIDAPCAGALGEGSPPGL